MITGKNSLYVRVWKPILDRILGLLALICLSWLYLLIAFAIWIDDPGPVLFKQKRVGIRKKGELTYFNILKFRTMKLDTPHDMPTHLLENPERWITRIGKVLRRTSLDELPQIWNIAITHDLSIVGPRPALWNQYDLIEERDKYGANDVMPGLTGWAQINGRDELEIAEKARLDGEYVKKLSLFFDLRCLLKTVIQVVRGKGVVEGGTGNKRYSTNQAVSR